MNCNDVDRTLSEDLRLPLQAQEHVKSCTRCQELVSALNMPGALDPPSSATLRNIAEGIGTNLSPVRLIAPARCFLIAFIGIFCVHRRFWCLLHGSVRHRSDDPAANCRDSGRVGSQ
jgi:hypothetical protein